MKKNDHGGLDFIIDKLTNSIENVVTGDRFRTDIIVVTTTDVKFVTKKNEWQFDWKTEFLQPERSVYKLTIVSNETIIQGLISLEIKSDHVFVHLIESAPFNKGKSKIYAGVPGNLIAFACKLSFQRGLHGIVAFIAKTKLIDHYKLSLGATHWGGHLMSIENTAALKLINCYFKN